MTKMKTTLFIALILSVITLSSCTDVAFDQPLPPNEVILTEMPAELVGSYENKEGDELIIEQVSLRVLDKDHQMGPKTQMKQFKDTYFLNLEDEEGNFQVFFAQLDGQDLKVYWFDGEDDKTLKKLNDLAHVETRFSENGEVDGYVVHITQKEFLDLWSAEAYNKLDTYYRVD